MEINLEDIEYITETSLTIRGTRRRVTLPKEIAEYHNLQDGDHIRWILYRDGRILLVPKKRTE